MSLSTTFESSACFNSTSESALSFPRFNLYTLQKSTRPDIRCSGWGCGTAVPYKYLPGIPSGERLASFRTQHQKSFKNYGLRRFWWDNKCCVEVGVKYTNSTIVSNIFPCTSGFLPEKARIR